MILQIKINIFQKQKTDAIAMDYSLAPNYQYEYRKVFFRGVEFEIKAWLEMVLQ